MTDTDNGHYKVARSSSGTPEFNYFWKMSGRKLSTDVPLKEIKKAFKKYDTDGDGEITFEEAHEVLKNKLGFDGRKTRMLLKSCDKNGDGVLSYEEFEEFYLKVKAKVQELHSMFDVFDQDGDGYITLEEAKEAMLKLAFREEEVEEMLIAFDSNGDGVLEYHEFVKLWNST